MFGHYGQLRPGVPGDNGPPQLRPEIVAAEQRILTHVDALLTWMKTEVKWDTRAGNAVDRFFTHEGPNPLTRFSDDPTGDKAEERITHYILNKLDPDANRIVFEIIRAAWERRCWQANYGERGNPHE